MVAALDGKSVTGVWRACEKAVKAPDESGSRSRFVRRRFHCDRDRGRKARKIRYENVTAL
jgi:hypothetical protein